MKRGGKLFFSMFIVSPFLIFIVFFPPYGQAVFNQGRSREWGQGGGGVLWLPGIGGGEY